LIRRGDPQPLFGRLRHRSAPALYNRPVAHVEKKFGSLFEARLEVLVSPTFLLGLCLLLANDFVLKPLFHNALTGKLSDFAGLFVFALFWSALLPRFAPAVHVWTALAFAFWKSSYSQPLIETWNSLGLLPVGRVVDPTDLSALLVLPLSYLHFRRGRPSSPARDRRLAPRLATCLSLFAFTATSYFSEFHYAEKYYFDEPAAMLLGKISHLEHLDEKYGVRPCFGGRAPASDIEVNIPSEFCFNSVEATFSLGEEQGRGTITLKKMGHRCPEGRDDKRELRAIFEREFIGKIRGMTLASLAAADAPPTAPAPVMPAHPGGRLYFLLIGDVPHVNVEKLAAHFRVKYNAPARALRKLALTDEMRGHNSPNGRPVAEKVIEALAREHPHVLETKNDWVVGVIEDMSVGSDRKPHPISYDLWGHFALVSANSLRPETHCDYSADPELFQTRLRKAVAKTLGPVYFRLPKSEDPRSLLYHNLGCVHELDYQSEDF
jgi:predicted Zn-dependent protease